MTYPNQHGYITFEHNGFECQYHVGNLKNPQSMKLLSEELADFVSFFSEPAPEAGVSWSDVHDDTDRDVFDFFQGKIFISNEWASQVGTELLDQECSFEDACKRATMTLKNADDYVVPLTYEEDNRDPKTSQITIHAPTCGRFIQVKHWLEGVGAFRVAYNGHNEIVDEQHEKDCKELGASIREESMNPNSPWFAIREDEEKAGDN